jgi:hypothetical protein
MAPDHEKKSRMKHEDVGSAAALEDGHGEGTKCAFCDRPAVTMVKGYPVCEEHAEMLYREGEKAPESERAPKMTEGNPRMVGAKAKQEKNRTE